MSKPRLSANVGAVATALLFLGAFDVHAVTVIRTGAKEKKTHALSFSRKGPIEITDLEKQGLELSAKNPQSVGRTVALEGNTLIHGPSQYFASPFAVVIGDGPNAKNSIVTFAPDWGLTKVTVPNQLSGLAASPMGPGPGEDYQAFEQLLSPIPPLPLTFETFNGKHLTRMSMNVGMDLTQETTSGKSVYKVKMRPAGEHTEAKMVLGSEAERTLRITPVEGGQSVISEIVNGDQVTPKDANRLAALWLEPLFEKFIVRALSTAKLIPLIKLENDDPVKLAMRLHYQNMGLASPF